jgi:hypothetical protein
MKSPISLFLLWFCIPPAFSATEKIYEDGERSIREDGKPSQTLQADRFSLSLPNESGWVITKFFKPRASLPYRYFCEKQTGRGDTGYAIDAYVDGPPKGETYKQYIEARAAHYKNMSGQPSRRLGNGLLESKEIEMEPIIKGSQGHLTLRTRSTSEFTKIHKFTERYGFSQQWTETRGVHLEYSHVYYLGYRDPKIQDKVEVTFSSVRSTDLQ